LTKAGDAALSYSSKLGLNHAMGADCGFDIYPHLERTKTNQEKYELFLREVLNTYGPRDGDDAERGDGGSVVRVNAESV
jgi:hypothetical protein